VDPPDDPGAAVPNLRFAMPVSLFPARSVEIADPGTLDALVGLNGPTSWFIPALVTGVPGLLLIVLVLGNILLGVSWLPNVGRLLGPEPEEPDDDEHLWWASGKPLH
jgi:hypothetical protein